MRQLNLFPPDITLQDGHIRGPLPPNTPIIVSNGVGVDSVALLIELHPEELWLIVILEAHAQINLKKIRGLWGHGERMTEYIIRRGLLPATLVEAVWLKWSAPERPSELRDNPKAVADIVLFNEVRRLVTLSTASPNGLNVVMIIPLAQRRTPRFAHIQESPLSPLKN